MGKVRTAYDNSSTVGHDAAFLHSACILCNAAVFLAGGLIAQQRREFQRIRIAPSSIAEASEFFLKARVECIRRLADKPKRNGTRGVPYVCGQGRGHSCKFIAALDAQLLGSSRLPLGQGNQFCSSPIVLLSCCVTRV